MNDRITAGAAALMASLAVGTGLVRWAVTPVRQPGRHRRDPLTTDSLLGPAPAFADIDFTDVPVAGVLTQAWRPCGGPCGGDMPSVVHADGSHTCGHCFTTTTIGGNR